MTHRRAVQRLSSQMPRWLKALRGRMALDPYVERLGIEEVECPACRGSGWLDRASLERCPACCGFEKVPRSVARWVDERLGCRARPRPPGAARGDRAASARGALPQRLSPREPGLVVWILLKDDPGEQEG